MTASHAGVFDNLTPPQHTTLNRNSFDLDACSRGSMLTSTRGRVRARAPIKMRGATDSLLTIDQTRISHSG